MALATPTIILLVAAPLIVWRMYARIRRLIGRQQSRAWRHWAAAILFPLLAVLLGIGTLGAPLSMVALFAGLAGGVGLALLGLRLTKFEYTDTGYFYTPSAHIGIALSLLLVARIGYRFFQMSTLVGAEAALASQEFGRSPLTLIVIGLMAGYYASYAIGLLRWRRAASSSSVLEPSPESSNL